MKERPAERLARGLSGPEAFTEGHERMLGVAQNLQILVGAVALVAIWIVPPTLVRDQITVTALLLGVYLPWTIVSRRVAVLSEGALARVLNLALDLAAVSSFALLIPYTRTAVMFGYVLIIAFHAYVSGRAAGLTMAAAALGLVFAAERLAPPADRSDGFTVVMYAVVLVSLVIMLDELAVERRRAARHLARLQRALAGFADEPSLAATTDAIAATARAAVKAGAVAVFLPREEAGEVDIAGQSGFPDGAADAVRAAVRNLERMPAGVAMSTGRPVAITDVATDDRFSHMAPSLAAWGVSSMVSVPLGPPSNPIGVLNAYFAEADAFDDDDLHLLTEYARQASTMVARAMAFEQERRAATRLANADRLKSEFVSTVSHELRTPLTSVCGFIDTVLLQWDRLGDADKQDLLRRSAWNATELRRLIEQVLAFSAIDAADDSVVDLRPYALAAGVADLVRHMGPALRGCPVDVDIDEDVVVLANQEAMHQVMGNLLTNASKFSEEGSPIRVIGRREAGWARLQVVDHGPGIAPEDHERIFERFYRGTTTRATRGTGIGLAIVRATVEGLGGTVTVRSDPGSGSTFEITLPLADAGAEATVLVV